LKDSRTEQEHRNCNTDFHQRSEYEERLHQNGTEKSQHTAKTEGKRNLLIPFSNKLIRPPMAKF
jgi:hypothetical protein